MLHYVHCFEISFQSVKRVFKSMRKECWWCYKVSFSETVGRICWRTAKLSPQQTWLLRGTDLTTLTISCPLHCPESSLHILLHRSHMKHLLRIKKHAKGRLIVRVPLPTYILASTLLCSSICATGTMSALAADCY